MHGVALPRLPQISALSIREKTWIETRSAPGATPAKLAPRPAAMPAACVPCSHPAMPTQCSPELTAADVATPPGQRLVTPTLGSLLEKQASATTRDSPLDLERTSGSYPRHCP